MTAERNHFIANVFLYSPNDAFSEETTPCIL